MNRRLFTVFAVLLAAGAGACAESLDSGAGCPRLCPAQGLAVLDTLINPVLVFDSTFSGYPEIGSEQEILLATRGDTLESRGVIRFDTLTTLFIPSGDTTVDTLQSIVHVDSAYLRIIIDTVRARLPDQIRFELFDVEDTLALDTLSGPVNAHFSTDRLIGGITVKRAFLPETLSIPIIGDSLLRKLRTSARLRVGIRVDGSGPVWLRIGTLEGSAPAQLRYKGSNDPTISIFVINPSSGTPNTGTEQGIRTALADYTILAKNAIPQFGNTMNVGGNPGRRAYLRFNIPSHILDSSTIIRASLYLTQRPIPYGDKRDTMTIHAHVVLASSTVRDLRRAANIISSTGLDVTDSLLVSPRDSGLKTIDMFALLRAWRAQGQSTTILLPPTRSIVLRASPENVLPFEASFYSSNGPVSVRPAMRISYIPSITFGVP